METNSVAGIIFGKKAQNLEPLPEKPDDMIIAKYDYFYIYKWKKFNIDLQKYYNKLEEERIRK